MNAMQTFNFEHNTNIRCVERNGDAWFVGKDVAAILGYGDTTQAIRKHCKGGVEMTLPSNGGMQSIKVIPERDVYRLIMRSKKPEAERFEEWVVGTVLPSIRKTGSYGQSSDVAELKQMIANLSEKIDNMQTVKPLPAPSNMIRVKDINEMLGGFYTSHKVNMALMMVGFQTRYHNGRQNQWMPTRKAKKYCATVGYGLSWNEQFIKDNLEAIENALANI